MEYNTENTVHTFEKAFNSQPAWLQKMLRAKIIYRCGWESRTTFYNKLNGTTPIKPPEKAVIALLFAEHGIDSWSGDELILN